MPTKVKIKKEFKLEKINLEKIISGLVLFSVLLLPLFIGIGRVVILEFNKQLFLIVFGYAVFLIWVASHFLKGEFVWRPHILSFFVFGFLIIVLISSIFSRWQWGSFWGWPLDASFNFLLVLGFFLFYVLISNIFREPKELFSLQFLLIISGFLVALIGIFQLFNKFILPWDFTKINSFNTIGTVNSWAVFLGALTGPVLALFFVAKKQIRNILLVMALFIFGGLIIVNYWIAWLEVLISTTILLAFGLWKIKEFGAKILIIPALLFSLAFLFGILKAPGPNLAALPLEISPSLKATFDVSKDMLQTSVKDTILGWGPGTFKYGWSKFKSQTINQTIFWNIRFSKGGSELLESLGTIGALGTAIYILIIVFAIYLGTKEFLKLQKEKKSMKNVLFLSTFCGLASTSLVKFFYPTNLALGFLWWFFLANLMALMPVKEKILKLRPETKSGFLFSFLIILLSIGAIFLFYIEGTRYIAEAKHNYVLTKGGTIESVEANLLSTVGFNPHQEVFFRDLSQFYLLKANQEIIKTDVSNEEKMNNVAAFVRNAVAAAGRATTICPENVFNWQNRGEIYKNLIGLSDGAGDWAITSYEKAGELEPNNPYILLEMARIYFAQATLIPDNPDKVVLLEQAENTLQESIQLKSDYAPAFYQMALVYNAQGKRQEAITTLESLKQAASLLSALGYDPMQDVGLAFQLGILYYQSEENGKAQTEFERAISLDPDYANARYFLAIVYDQLGQKNKAIEQLETIEKQFPDNETVKQALANIKAGKPAIGEETPEELPIEKGPEEK